MALEIVMALFTLRLEDHQGPRDMAILFDAATPAAMQREVEAMLVSSTVVGGATRSKMLRVRGEGWA